MPRGRPGVNEVVVEIEVAPVNGADLLFAAGWFGGYPDVRAPMGQKATTTVIPADRRPILLGAATSSGEPAMDDLPGRRDQ